jgi:hypothetical protein
MLLARGIHVQIVTSAFRTMGSNWASLARLHVVVSIDGLQPEHDVGERQQPTIVFSKTSWAESHDPLHSYRSNDEATGILG